MTRIALRRIGAYEDLLAAAGPALTMVRLEAGPSLFQASWAAAGGIAFTLPDPDLPPTGPRLWLTGAGADEGAVTACVRAALDECGDEIVGMTAPRSVPLEPWQAGPGTAWDLMVCDAPPPAQRAESDVVDLAEPDAVQEIQQFLDRVNAHHSVRADDPTATLWAGVRDEASGVLLAVGALTRRPSGVGYLASIATDQLARGRGLGSAVTARLTRQAFALGDPVCTLAHYHPNDAARSIYLALGYRTTDQLHSGTIAR
jgi:ribosomal protein S18 acetylase RimI-like enzyme